MIGGRVNVILHRTIGLCPNIRANSSYAKMVVGASVGILVREASFCSENPHVTHGIPMATMAASSVSG